MDGQTRCALETELQWRTPPVLLLLWKCSLDTVSEIPAWPYYSKAKLIHMIGVLPRFIIFFSKQSFWNYHYQYTNACWRLVGSDIGSDVIREPLILTALEQETFSLRNTILENCRLQFNINQISTLNMISENNLIFLFFPLFFLLLP